MDQIPRDTISFYLTNFSVSRENEKDSKMCSVSDNYDFRIVSPWN